MMRILLVIDTMEVGGAERQFIELATELVNRGHEVCAYVLRKRGPRLADLEKSGAQIHLDEKGFGVDLFLAARLRRVIVSWRPDVVHSFLFYSDIHTRLASVGLSVPVINSERNDNYELPSRKQLFHLLTRKRCDAVIANSYAGKRFAEGRYRLDPERIMVAWNGLRLEVVERRIAQCITNYKKEFFDNDSVKVACLVGSFKPQKDYLLAIEVAKRLVDEDPSWRILFIGGSLVVDPTGYQEKVVSAYKESGLGNSLVFAGKRSDVMEIVSQCDVLYVTSRHEGFPNVVLEAMGAGTPVVSTEYSDICRILPESWQVVSTRSPSDLADAIRRALREGETLRKSQREWVERYATIARATDRIVEIYQGLESS